MPQPRTHVGSTREETQITNNTLHMISEHHSDTPRHAKQKCSSPQCTSSHNQIFHAPRTAAAHTRSDKCSSDRCYPRAAVGSKQKRRAAKPQKGATTVRKSTECCHSNEFSPHALSLSPSPQNDAVQLQRILQNRKSPTRSGISYAPSSHTKMQMKKQCFSWTAMRTVPRRHQLRLGAEAGASRHTTRYFLVGCVHSALHDGEAITPCPVPVHLHGLGVRHCGSCAASLGPRASKENTSVHLTANPAPLRRSIGFRAPTQHKRLTLLRCIEDVRSLSTRNLCRHPCIINWRHQSRFRGCCY
ncbi:hypothetical protein TcCL_Unassigned04695 [Trypanosoma cruzi]|nr:hypothetical protein TcCL_Unassigned04695 [Trypanosoma cruzi]